MAAGGAFVCHRTSVLHFRFGRGSTMIAVCADHRQRSSIHRHRCPTVVAFSFHRFGYACALVVPCGEGIGSLHLRLQAFTLRCAPLHFFRLRFRSPMPGERGNDAGTYQNPSPRPPPAIISGRGIRSHRRGYCHSSPSSRCSLRSRLSLSASVLHVTTQDGTSPPKISITLRRRQPPRRVPPRFGSRLSAANRLSLPEKQPPHPKRRAR